MRQIQVVFDVQNLDGLVMDTRTPNLHLSPQPQAAVAMLHSPHYSRDLPRLDL